MAEDAEGRSRGGGPVGQVKTPKAGFGSREEQEGDARECIAFISFSSLNIKGSVSKTETILV